MNKKVIEDRLRSMKSILVKGIRKDVPNNNMYTSLEEALRDVDNIAMPKEKKECFFLVWYAFHSVSCAVPHNLMEKYSYEAWQKPVYGKLDNGRMGVVGTTEIPLGLNYNFRQTRYGSCS